MSRTNRRTFVRKLLLASEAAAERTVVCVFLRGGADTLNMVIPFGDDDYYKLRPTIAIPQSAGLRLDNFYAFHPNLAPLLPAFKEGRLGVVQAVGTDNPSGSHFEAQDQMEHGEGYGHIVGGGWLGRYLRLGSGNLTPLSAVAIGSSIPESLRGAPTASAIESLEEVQIKTPGNDAAAMSAVLSTLYGAEVGTVGLAGKTTLDLLSRVETLRGATYMPENGASYLDDNFSHGLKEIARLIKARVGLEVACLDLGGWDTHFFQGSTTGLQADLIRQFAGGLAAFDQDLGTHRDRVTTLVITEFGRRTYENSSLGTDHGRGFALFALGGLVKGGKVHGRWPGLIEESSSQTDALNPVGPSGLKVLIDYRSVLAEVLKRFMGHRDASEVFPKFQPEPVGLFG